MILSVSRRTDIPAFYSDWFFNRLREGYVLVRNPMNYHQVSRVILNPDIIDCIVFWTKDPANMLHRLDYLTDYHYYFQITISPYDNKTEKYLPPKDKIIESFQVLSRRIGKEKTIWRYDPIILTKEIDLGYHAQNFELLASNLKGYTERCIISFVDLYQKTQQRMKRMKAEVITDQRMLEIGTMLSKIADKYHFRIETCSEQIDLSEVGIQHAKCIDDKLISEIIGREMIVKKDKTQRDSCACAASIDIGVYHTCKHGCLYCYAYDSDRVVRNNLLKHNPESPMLIGDVEPEDGIIDRKMVSYINKSNICQGEINFYEQTKTDCCNP